MKILIRQVLIIRFNFMVQEDNMQFIPEELYNLTQLAEVTLAAVRLSTTNVNIITEYINKEKNMISTDTEKNNEIVDRRKAKYHKSPIMNNSINDTRHFPILENENYKKVIKINNLNEKKTIHNQPLFSSDDDSNYYTHKIFDRKKSRRLTVSDNSRYDELSCSSPPSSGEEHFVNHSTSNTSGNHMISSEDDHICPECGKKYSTSSNLARHRQTHRSILDKKARRCPHCEKVYVSMPAYSMHVRTHSQGCQCQHCGKCFSRPWLLQGHIRTHTGEKPFKCSICTKAFADKSNLRAHIQTHSNTKPYSCTRCGKSFALKSYLYKHEESSCMRNNQKNDKDKERIKTTKIETLKTSIATKVFKKQQYCIPSKETVWENLTSEEQIIPEDKSEKSYTTLTTSMSQNDYDHLARISVIRSPISNSSFESNDFDINFYQENPVDFSPKNNFTHSSKTRLFEITNNFALVA